MKLEHLFIVLLCITELIVPGLGAVCGVMDGSAANSVACTCGSMECTSTTGLICYSTYGGGSCRKTGFGPFGYIKEEGNKMCGSESNRKPLPDKAACEAGATSMGLDDVEATEDSWSWLPPGCFWGFGTTLYYNTLSTSTRSCTYNSDFCLCIAAPDCNNISGATLNDAPCLCGGTGCTGLFCDASNTETQCSPPLHWIWYLVYAGWIIMGVSVPGSIIVGLYFCWRKDLLACCPNSASADRRVAMNGKIVIARSMNPLQVLDASAELEAIFARDRTGDGDEERAKELEEILKQFTPIPVSPATSAVSSIEMGAPVKKNEISEESNGQWSVHVQ